MLWMSLLYLIATNIQAGWLYVIISFLGLLCIYSLIIPVVAIRSVKVRVELPEFSERGRESIATVFFENTSRRPRYLFRVEFAEDKNFDFKPAGALAVKLEGGSRLAIPVKFIPSKRGMVTLEKVFLSSGAPMGIVIYYRRIKIGAKTLVYPKITPEDGEKTAGSEGDAGQGPREKFFALTDPYHYKLREYVPGDGLSNIHWKLTAKRDRPIVKINERKIFGHSGIRVDNILENYPENADEMFEEVLEKAASLAYYLLFVRGSSISVSGTAAPEISIESTDTWSTALEWFARIRLEARPDRRNEFGNAENEAGKEFEFAAKDALVKTEL